MGLEFLAIEKQQRINEQIRISPVRVISADGAQLGIIPTDDALSEARTAGLDLVEVAPDYDLSGSTSILAAQILMNFIGYIQHYKN